MLNSIKYFTTCSALIIVLQVKGYINRPIKHIKNFQIYAESYKKHDDYDYYNKLLFDRFALAVGNEINKDRSSPSNYESLISTINSLVFSAQVNETSQRSKNMLVALFPPGLLPAYKFLFGGFPRFSAWMNTWVTHWSTQWLMGPSKVEDLQIDDQTLTQQLLVIEKCKFLETSACIQTCIHACKVPTQRFFNEEMGLPVTLRPNFTDYSCRFEFGVMPIPWQQDKQLIHPCISTCPQRQDKICCSGTKII